MKDGYRLENFDKNKQQMKPKSSAKNEHLKHIDEYITYTINSAAKILLKCIKSTKPSISSRL